MKKRSRRTRTVVLACCALLVAVPVGLGTASASDHGPRWWRWGETAHPRPTRTAPPRPATPSAKPTPTRTPSRPASPTPSPSAGGGATTSPKPGTGQVTLPPANGGVDYQIGGAYTPPAGVDIVLRDHTAKPAAGKYNVCYVNGFQTQTEAADWWHSKHSDLLLRSGGKEVVDSDWNEIILDIGTPAKRAALAVVVGEWIDGCADAGFRAVEVDNLDTYTRSKGLLTAEHAMAYAKLLADRAHARGLAVGQKNTVELGKTGKARVGFDFAIAEECAEWDECQDYVDVYGNHVIAVEYSDASFQKACSRFGSTLSIVRRDRNVTTPGSSSYKFTIC